MKKLAFGLMAALSTAIAADEPPAPPADATTLETVTVTGEQPGPGLWKVSNGEHVLWILGVQYPLPKGMSWHAKQVDDTIAQSQEVIADAAPKLEVSFLHKLTLLPSIYSARKNADGATLKDVLPPEVYARWEPLKTKYFGNDDGVEKLRPLVAANELYDKALAKSGLARNGVIWRSVRDTAKKNHVKIVDMEVSIPVDDPGQTIRDFKSTSGNSADVECLSATMTRIETDLDAMRQRANAWAVGDIEALKKLPSPGVQAACLGAVASNERLHQQLDAAMAQIQTTWLAAAEKALHENASTFAVLPMDELLRPDRRLAKLREKGYSVEEPE
ncbi:MAG TPA: TraB/GumN family protein [Rudaea sp.]